MSVPTLPIGEIILTNEHDLIGAGYNYGLTGPTPDPVHDTGSFSLTGNGEDRLLRFDHCFILDPLSVPWEPSEAERRGFFVFLFTKEDGTVISSVSRDFSGDPKLTFKNYVHYREGHGSPYNIPAPKSLMPDGNYILTCSVNPEVAICPAARFFIGVLGEDSWMTAPPIHPITLLPFVEGAVTWKDLNPAAPHP